MTLCRCSSLWARLQFIQPLCKNPHGSSLSDCFCPVYQSSLISLTSEHFCVGDGGNRYPLTLPSPPQLTYLLGRTDSYIFCLPRELLLFLWQNSSLSPNEDISPFLCVNEIPPSYIPVPLSIPFSSWRPKSVIAMPYLFGSLFGFWGQIVVGVMCLCDSTEKDCNNTWNSKKNQS